MPLTCRSWSFAEAESCLTELLSRAHLLRGKQQVGHCESARDLHMMHGSLEPRYSR